MKQIVLSVIFAWSYLVLPSNAQAGSEFEVLAPACLPQQSCRVNVNSCKVAKAAQRSCEIPSASICLHRFQVYRPGEMLQVCERALVEFVGDESERATLTRAIGVAQLLQSAFMDENSSREYVTRGLANLHSARASLPQYLDPLLDEAVYLTSLRKYPDALSIMDKVESEGSGNWRYLLVRSHILANAGSYNGAIEAAEGAVQLRKDSKQIQHVLGRVLLLAGRLDEAERVLGVAVRLVDDDQVAFVPDLPLIEDPRFDLARVYELKNMPSKALAILSEYISEKFESDNVPWPLLEQRAGLYEKAGRLAEAANDLATVSKQLPPQTARDVELRRNLLLARLAGGRQSNVDLGRILEAGRIQDVLRLQVFLKNQGYGYVEINGRRDDATQKALRECEQDKICLAVAGRGI